MRGMLSGPTCSKWISTLVASFSFCAASPLLAQAHELPGPQGAVRLPKAPESTADSSNAEADAADEPKENKGFFDQFIDDEDYRIDFSRFLAKGGFIPLPIIITEPAVENGFGVAAVFLTVPKDNPRQVTRRALAAFKTGNGSKAIGYFQSGFGFDGRLNYRIGVGHGKINLEAFPAFAPEGLNYTNNYDYGLLAAGLLRLGETGFSVGPLLDFRKLRSKLDFPSLPPSVTGDFNHTLRTGALGFGLHFDSRDNPLTPTQGLNAYVDGKFNRGAFGSDRDFEDYDANLYWFGRVGPELRFGFKTQFGAIRGDFPVYFAPAIELRGVQAIRYQGQNVISSEFELTKQLSSRWSLLAFGGLGATDAGDRRLFKNSGLIKAGGVGFRYRIARKLGLDAGLDFAYGPGGFVYYIQLGHAWTFRMD